MLYRYGSERFDRIVFSDEKLLFTEQSYNAKNDAVCSATFDDTPENLQTIQLFQNENSIMFYAAMSNNGKLPLKFIDNRLKVDADH